MNFNESFKLKISKNQQFLFNVINIIDSIPFKYRINGKRLKKKFHKLSKEEFSELIDILLKLNIIDKEEDDDIYYKLRTNRKKARKSIMDMKKKVIPSNIIPHKLFDEIGVLNIDEMNDLNDLAVNFFKSYVDTYHHPKRYFTENITLAFLIPFLKERFPFVSPFETKLISGMIECVFHSTNEIGKWDFGIDITSSQASNSIKSKFKYAKEFKKCLYIIIFSKVSDEKLNKLKKIKPNNIKIIRWNQIEDFFNQEFPSNKIQNELKIPDDIKQVMSYLSLHTKDLTGMDLYELAKKIGRPGLITNRFEKMIKIKNRVSKELDQLKKIIKTRNIKKNNI